jgi:hypothetical protein
VGVRLVRVPGRPARVAGDVRAALASLTGGGSLVGGIALVGTRPTGAAHETAPEDPDAILVLPHGVVVVVGIDLPGPAKRLEAPLAAAWTVDGWPLVRTDDALNPAGEALALADTIANRVRVLEPDLSLGAIVAVGPYVEAVEQPSAEASGAVRVVHPTAASMLAATTSLVADGPALPTGRARRLLRALAPSAPELDDATLAAEGFTVDGASSDSAPAARTAPDEPVEPAAPPETAAGGVAPRVSFSAVPAPVRSPMRRRRRLAIAAGAAAVVAATAIVAIVIPDAGPADSPQAAPPVTASAGGITFTLLARGADQACAPHAVGDMQVFLAKPGCAVLRRGSFEATVRGRRVAVSVAVVRFAEGSQAENFHALAEKPGTGAIADLATETRRWTGATPRFAHAAYASERAGATVRLVLACMLGNDSRADDPVLVHTAKAALDLRLDR